MMKASRAPLQPGLASTSLRVDPDRPPTAWRQTGNERTPEAGPTMSGVTTYRGIRSLKHRNERLHRAATAGTDDGVVESCRPPTTVRQPPPAPPARQSVTESQSSIDQPCPVDTSSSARRSVSADRQRVSTTSTPRTFFETLYHDKVGRHGVLPAH